MKIMVETKMGTINFFQNIDNISICDSSISISTILKEGHYRNNEITNIAIDYIQSDCEIAMRDKLREWFDKQNIKPV